MFTIKGYTAMEYQLLSDLKKAGLENANAEKTIRWLLEDSEYRVSYHYPSNVTVFQRLNQLWFVPLFIVFIAPINWILKGHTGFDPKNKFAQFMAKYTGLN